MEGVRREVHVFILWTVHGSRETRRGDQYYYSLYIDARSRASECDFHAISRDSSYLKASSLVDRNLYTTGRTELKYVRIVGLIFFGLNLYVHGRRTQ